MRILISNDDGVFSPGINSLAKELSHFYKIEVVAPDRNRSGASSSLTLSQPIRIKQLENSFYSVEGTPTDCVHLAVTGFLNDKVDMVVSGINDGPNLGDDTIYSGTVAAAIEGRYLGLPALAISMVGETIQHYDTAAIITRQLVANLSSHNLPSQTILNVNVPDVPLDQIKGLQVTRLGTRHSSEHVVKDQDPRGRPIYWIGLPGPQADAGPGTDFHAINEGYVSITPLHLDMTNYKLFDHLAHWLNGINIKGTP